MLRRFLNWISICLIIALFASCSEPVDREFVVFSTESTKAMEFYNLGWKQIMDDGYYGEAEVSYRAALAEDPDFLVGQAVLARLTLDLDERIDIYNRLEEGKDEITGDERLILDVYIAFTKLTNLRAQNDPAIGAARTEALQLAERNLRTIVHRYPKEIYLKAEYLEILHANHGPKQALDTLRQIVIGEQRNNPFILGYEAIMQAEIGQYANALLNANKLRTIINNSAVPKSDAVFADIYFNMDSFETAKTYADRANRLDPRNLDASRLKTGIDQALMEQKSY